MLAKWVKYIFLLPLAAIPFIFLYHKNTPPAPKESMLRGVNLVATPQEIHPEDLKPIKDIGANWVAVVPYAFSRPNQPQIHFDVEKQWWGERKAGVITTITHAKSLGLKVMLKPHVWVSGQGWPGDFTLSNDEDWKIWESQYEQYIFSFIPLADSLEVEMICIGTEFRQASAQRPKFWQGLIEKLRNRYKGKLTYAANWDEFEDITFWEQLDYIGIDAYFPLSKEKTPSVEKLVKEWKKPLQSIQEVHEQTGKPVIFTEYGYQSIDYTASEHWNLNHQQLRPNMEAQSRAFEALYKTFWEEPWFAGGFIWKWFPDHSKAGGITDKEHSPQNKPVEAIIKKWYGRKE